MQNAGYCLRRRISGGETRWPKETLGHLTLLVSKVHDRSPNKVLVKRSLWATEERGAADWYAIGGKERDWLVV